MLMQTIIYICVVLLILGGMSVVCQISIHDLLLMLGTVKCCNLLVTLIKLVFVKYIYNLSVHINLVRMFTKYLLICV